MPSSSHTPPYAASYVSGLSDAHTHLLEVESAIPADIIAARGYVTLESPEEVRALAFSGLSRKGESIHFHAAQSRTAPVLAIPLWSVLREQTAWQIRPDHPRQDKKGKIIKYDYPIDGRLQLDVHPRMQERLADPGVALWITEGARKCDSLTAWDCCTIDLMGVWGFRGTNDHGGKVILPDWQHIALNDRAVHIVFDSDLHTKKEVALALRNLCMFLHSRQARVSQVRWSAEYQERKWGVDDFFAVHHTLDALRAMLLPMGPRTTASVQIGLNGTHARATADPQDGASGSLPSRFTMNAEGLWSLRPPDELGLPQPPIKVCAPLHVVAATRDEDNDNHGYLLQFHDRHGHPHEWAMPLELLEDQREYRKVLRSLGLEIRNSTRQLWHEYLETIRVPDRARCVARIGWHGSAYVLPGGTLGDPGEERLVLQNLEHTAEGYRQKGTLEDWHSTVAAMCSGNSRLVLAVACAFAAPLLSVLDEESGGVHLRGASSEGKTTALLVAGSVWGEPGRLENWRATANALEGVALAHNDNLLCLDELKQVDPREAGHVAYMLANGVGKRRAQAYGGNKPRLQWRLLFLSTGELSLEQHIAEAGQRIQAGQEVRLVDVPADAGQGLGLFEELHGNTTGQAFAETLKAQSALHYGHAGRAFVTNVAADLSEAIAQVRTCMTTLVAYMLPHDAAGQVYRVARRFALIGAAGELATSYSLTGWEQGVAAEAATRCFEDWLGQRGSAGNTDEPRAIAQVRLYFERYGASRFEPWREDDGETCQRCHGTGKVGYTYLQGLCFTCQGTGTITPEHPAIRLIQIRAGWAKATDDGGTEFYVQQEIFRQDIAKGLDVQWLCRVLKQQGYLRPATDGKNTRKETVPGHPDGTRVYRITETLLGTQKPGNHEEEDIDTWMGGICFSGEIGETGEIVSIDAAHFNLT